MVYNQQDADRPQRCCSILLKSLGSKSRVGIDYRSRYQIEKEAIVFLLGWILIEPPDGGVCDFHHMEETTILFPRNSADGKERNTASWRWGNGENREE